MTRGLERADRRRNRRRILDAATQVLGSDPTASMADVAHEAGLTRATVYRHFADRDELVEEMTRDVAQESVPALLDRMQGLPLDHAMRLLAETIVTIAANQRGVIATIGHQLEGWARTAAHDEPVAAEITVRRARGEVTSPHPDAWLALCVWGLCLAALVRAAAGQADGATVTAELTASLRRLLQ